MPVLSGNKWATSGQPFPTVTWSFAIDNYDFSGLYSGYLDFDTQIAVEFRPLARAAFDAWEAVSLIDFVEVLDSAEVDIRLGDILIDGQPAPGQTTTLGIAQSWMSGSLFLTSQIYFDIDAYDDRPTFYQVALHEIGHAIGLDHSNDPVDTMYPLVNAQNESGNLSAGDISGVQELYGARGGAPTIDTDFATAAASLFFLGALPTAAELDSRGDFADLQYSYYANVLKVANPDLGPYEALGSAFSALAAFRGAYGVAIDTRVFVQKAYDDVFHRAPTAGQLTHFIDQVSYFRNLYGTTGMSLTESEIKARGAVAGQILGVAMTTPAERALPAQTLDDTVNSYLAQSAVAKVGLVGMLADSGLDAYYGSA